MRRHPANWEWVMEDWLTFDLIIFLGSMRPPPGLYCCGRSILSGFVLFLLSGSFLLLGSFIELFISKAVSFLLNATRSLPFCTSFVLRPLGRNTTPLLGALFLLGVVFLPAPPSYCGETGPLRRPVCPQDGHALWSGLRWRCKLFLPLLDLRLELRLPLRHSFLI